MNIIAAVGENWEIGNKGELLVSIPQDQKMFRKETEGNVVVYGRKTLETFPQKQPLVSRKNIVLSKNPDYKVRNAEVVHSVEECLELLKQYPSDRIYIIGGQSVYEQFLPYCDVAHITKICKKYVADAFFPNLDESAEWEMTAESEEQTYFDLEYYFQKYERVKKD